MNSNELTAKVMGEVWFKIEPHVTEYLRQHPEYFHDCVNSSGKICCVNITLSYQPESLADVKKTKPSIFVFLGDLNKGHELNCYSHHQEDLQSRFWIGKELVTDRELPSGLTGDENV